MGSGPPKSSDLATRVALIKMKEPLTGGSLRLRILHAYAYRAFYKASARRCAMHNNVMVPPTRTAAKVQAASLTPIIATQMPPNCLEPGGNQRQQVG